MNNIWIDTTSGTWGDVDGSNGRLVIVDLDALAVRDSESGEQVDATSLVAFLEGASDSEIAEFGNEYGYQPGQPIVGNLEALGQAVRGFLPDAVFEMENDGQIVIYTGLNDMGEVSE